MSQNGLTQAKIREILGISRTTWEKYKTEKPELLDALNAQKPIKPEDRAEKVKELEDAMYRLAVGFKETERKVMRGKNDVIPYTEEVYFPPNFQAARFLLLNWGGYMSEPAAQEQRKREFEHKKAMDEKENW